MMMITYRFGVIRLEFVQSVANAAPLGAASADSVNPSVLQEL